MIEQEHADMVGALLKPGEDVLADLTPETANFAHLGLLVAGEAGELCDALKKAAIYKKPLDHANVVEELGDLEFALEAIRKATGVTREEALRGNIDKLAVRYAAKKFSNKAAQERKDKQ